MQRTQQRTVVSVLLCSRASVWVCMCVCGYVCLHAPCSVLRSFRSDHMAQLQRSSHEAVWEALLHTSGAGFQSRQPGSRAVSIAPLVTFFGMLLAWRRPKIWCSPSWFPMFGMGMQQTIWIYMDIYRDLYIDVAHTWLIM